MTRHDLYQTQPANGYALRWQDATPLGNGLTGVSVTGGCRRDVHIINRHDLWHRGKEGEIPCVADALQEMRRLAAAGDLPGAADLMYLRLKEKGYDTVDGDTRTLCQVEYFHTCDGVFREYRRTLHMDTGEADITYRLGDIPYRRRVFVSRKRDVIVTQLESGVPDGFAAAPGFFRSGEACESTVAQQDASRLSYRTDGQFVIYSTQNDDGRYFGAVLTAVSDGDCRFLPSGAAPIGGRGVPAGPHIAVENATRTVVLAAAFSGAADRAAGEREAMRRLTKAAEMPYEALFCEHRRLHRQLYNTADLKLYHGRVFHSNEWLLERARQDTADNELLEKQWRFGRYLFISGTHPKGSPFPLYGLWGCGYALPWTQHVANENVEMIYWHAPVGGLAKLMPALIHYYYGQMDTARKAAKNLFGCRGIFISAFSSPGVASPFPNAPIILHFIGSAGWLCRHFYEYYRFTGDEALMETEILPFMLETAAFYEDYVTEENGELMIYPGVSPENTPAEYADIPGHPITGHPMPVTKNPTMEVAILKELLHNLLTLSESRQLPEKRVAKWREMLAKMPAYRINQDGAVAEWIDPAMTDWYFHRHLSHIYPVFPGTEVKESRQDSLLPAFRRGVELRQLGAMTGWSMAHMASIYARFGDGEEALASLKMMAKVCVLPNLLTLHNDYRGMGITTENHGDLNWAPLQLDAAMGAVNALQEMAVFASSDRVALLPACPAAFAVGSAELHIYGGRLSLCWDLPRRYCRAVITALRDVEMTVELPFGKGECRLSLKAGETWEY